MRLNRILEPRPRQIRIPLSLRRTGLLGIAMALACLSAAAAADMVLLASSPGAGEAVAPPSQLVLRFSSRIEKAASSVTVVGPRNTMILLPRAAPEGGPDILVYPLPALKPGAYQARWRVLAPDGSVSEGAITFSVLVPPER